MSVTANDIIIYGAAVMPEDDTTASVGGAIDRSVKVSFTALDTDDTVTVVSDSGGDSATATVYGRLANGTLTTDPLTINGTTTGSGLVTFERVLKTVVTMGAAYNGTLTFSDGGASQTLFTMEGSGVAPGGTPITEIRRVFYGAVALPAGSGAKPMYEKVFVANTHETLALTSATIALSLDGTADDIIGIDLESSGNGLNTVANRLTEPDGSVMVGAPSWVTLASGGSIAVPETNLGDRGTGTSDHTGLWVKLALADGQAAEKADFTIKTQGNTT